jgi:hypothetical protein
MAAALVLGLGGVAMANTTTTTTDQGKDHMVKRVTHVSTHQRVMHRRHTVVRHTVVRHRGHRWAMRRHFRGFGAPMYGYGSSAPARSSISSSYTGNVTESLGTSRSDGVNQ